MKAKLSLLYNDNKPWVKKSSNELFDITMGSFASTKTSELVGELMQSKLKEMDINIGLYLDDGLRVSKLKHRLLEKKKKLTNIIKELGMKITFDQCDKVVDYLDVELDLNIRIVKPYCKPNNNVNMLTIIQTTLLM